MFSSRFNFWRRVLGRATLLSLALPAARSQTVLYLTDGSAQKLQAIDLTTGAILYTATTSIGAVPIAVRNTIVLGFDQNSGRTGEYNPANGALVGSLQTPTGTNWNPTSDGAASLTANFTASTAGSGPYNIYQTAPDWSAPGVIFTVGIQPYGIAYDSAADTLWISSTSGNIYQFSMTGTLISSFAAPLGGLAYQASTDTLWLVPTSGTLQLRHYSTSGTLLGTLATPLRSSGITGAEILAVPEPATWALLALGTGLAALRRRRRR